MHLLRPYDSNERKTRPYPVSSRNTFLQRGAGCAGHPDKPRRHCRRAQFHAWPHLCPAACTTATRYPHAYPHYLRAYTWEPESEDPESGLPGSATPPGMESCSVSDSSLQLFLPGKEVVCYIFPRQVCFAPSGIPRIPSSCCRCSALVFIRIHACDELARLCCSS